jgi:hypothetical protein
MIPIAENPHPHPHPQPALAGDESRSMPPLINAAAVIAFKDVGTIRVSSPNRPF